MVRFDLSLEKELLDALCNYTSDSHLPHRSQTIRQLINNIIITGKWQYNSPVADSIALVYDSYKKDKLFNITNVQHSGIFLTI
jgi:metal-responsive CopG/Arc/MetJ family transcriptional regulator